ncbi:hypothetical protein KR018_005362, partial [Drosophila ironensis]
VYLVHKNPLLQVAKCEMCTNPVSHFVTGMCTRCLTIWACGHSNKSRFLVLRQQGSLSRVSAAAFNLNQVLAAIVAVNQNQSDNRNMHPTFKREVEREKMRRTKKVELFRKVRKQFQNSVLMSTMNGKESTRFAVEEGYCNVPEIADMDYVNFQHQINLLGDKPEMN